MKHILLFAITAIMMIPSTRIIAKAPEFIFPVQCKLDTDCWMVNYVDVNPDDKKTEDFRCGPQSYDGHKGTDIAVRSRAEMRRGVNVIAAKAGQVLRLRDSESDTVKSADELNTVKKEQKECGNGLYLDHGNAVQTVYCHMKKGSITVKPGDKVEGGDILGQIGQSGLAEFPHLHFGVIWEGGVVDPFTGHLNTEGCGLYKNSLWSDKDAMKHNPVSIYDAGFKDSVPDFKKIEDGQQKPEIIRKDSDALVFWAAFYGVQKDDEITLRITDAQGRVFKDQKITQPKNRARQYYYTGRRLKGRALPAGIYKGYISLNRSGLAKQEKTITIDVR